MDFRGGSKILMENTNENHDSPDVSDILNRCERMVKGVCFEIVIIRSKNEEKERYLIDIDPEDAQFCKDINDHQETLDQRLNRIENLQGIYVELWDKTMAKIEELKEKFKHTDYKIVLLKRKSNFIEKKRKISHNDDVIQCDRYSDASTVVIDDRKSNCSSETATDAIEVDVPAKRQCKMDYPKISSCSKYVIIGPHGTKMNRIDYEELSWKDAGVSTRKLLIVLFGELVLATHSLTGNQSPAFRGRERAPKGKLNPDMTSDIIYLVTLKCNVSPQVVRAAITTKCADTSKKFRRISMKI